MRARRPRPEPTGGPPRFAGRTEQGQTRRKAQPATAGRFQGHTGTGKRGGCVFRGRAAWRGRGARTPAPCAALPARGSARRRRFPDSEDSAHGGWRGEPSSGSMELHVARNAQAPRSPSARGLPQAEAAARTRGGAARRPAREPRNRKPRPRHARPGGGRRKPPPPCRPPGPPRPPRPRTPARMTPQAPRKAACPRWPCSSPATTRP